MPTAGRPPKPVEQHKLEGTYRPDRHAERPAAPRELNVDGARATLKRPAFITGRAKTQWDKVAPILVAMGMDSPHYTISVALLADAVADWVIARERADKADPVIKTQNGSLMQHPAIGVKNRAWKRVLDIAREFGMTPSSVRGVQTPAAPVNPDAARQDHDALEAALSEPDADAGSAA